MIDEAALDAALDLFLSDVDRTVPYTVWVEPCCASAGKLRG